MSVSDNLMPNPRRSPARRKLGYAIAALREVSAGGDQHKIVEATRLRDEAVQAIVRTNPTVVAVFREHRELDRQLREAKRLLHFFAQQGAVPEPSSDVGQAGNTGAEAVDVAIVTWMDAVAALRLDPDALLPGEK